MDHHNTRAGCDSETYACRANHYNWTVPHPMWTAFAQNRILSKDEVDNRMHAPQDNDPDSGCLWTWCDSTKNDSNDESFFVTEEFLHKGVMLPLIGKLMNNQPCKSRQLGQNCVV